MLRTMKLMHWRLLAIGVSVASWVVLFGTVILHPDRFLFSAHGDGIKNYFTWAWHVRYDTQWLHFGGMNAPFGEHVGYTDGHHLLSLLIGWIPWVQEHPVGTLNFLMLVSIPLTTWIVFELLVRIGVVHMVAAVGSVCIGWMQPQLYRLEGHYALSYAFWIPLVLLLLAGAEERNRRYAWLLATVTAAFFIHPYTGMMLSLMLLAYWMLRWTILRTDYVRSVEMKAVFIAAVLPIALYLFFIRATDTHTNRAKVAHGFLEYTASYETVFVPHDPPLRHLISQVIKVHGQTWEGWAYIGVATMLVLIGGGAWWLFRRDKVPHEWKTPLTWFAASLPVLFFSFGWPFSWGLEEWLDRLPAVQQFRAPGRFAWVFYFTSTVLAFAMISAWWQRAETKRGRKGVMLLLAGAFVLFMAEGFLPMHHVSRRIAASPNLFDPDQLPGEWQRAMAEAASFRDEHTALVPVPFFHYGSDFYGRAPEGDMQKWALLLAWHTGIPLVASCNPRVSLSESRDQLALFDPLDSDHPAHSGWKLLGFHSGESGTLNWMDSLAWQQMEPILRTEVMEFRQFEPWRKASLELRELPFASASFPSDPDPVELKHDAFAITGSFECAEYISLVADVLIGGTDPLMLTRCSLVIQERTPDGGVKWLAHQPLASAPGHSGGHVRVLLPFRCPPVGSTVEFVVTQNSGHTLQLDVLHQRVCAQPNR